MAKTSRSFLDRAIAAIAPETGLRRARARAMLDLSASMGGYFGGAARRRGGLANWHPGVGDANADIIPDLVDLRGYSRDLARRTPLAGGAISSVVTNVVGTGLSMQPSPDAAFLGLDDAALADWTANVAREWSLWAETTACDITNTQNFYEMQSLAFRSTLESGDVFVITPVREVGRPYRLALQLIEADRVGNPGNQPDSEKLIAGIELDSVGAAHRYHICTTHPGQRMSTALTYTPVAALGDNGRRNVLHLFDRRRPGQVRGVPYLAAVIEPLKQLARYAEAELSAAVTSAAFALFVRMDAEAFGSLFADDAGGNAYLDSVAAQKWDGTVNGASLDGPSKAVNLLPGESVEAPDLNRPNAQFDPFFLAMVRQIGVALELPYEVLIKHYTASYSAARAALLDAWKFYRGRRDWIVNRLCQPVYELWLDEAVALGRVAAPGFFADPIYRRAWSAAVWTGDGPGSIDPLKEADAAEKRIELEISTRNAESILHDGIPWEVKHRQRVREEAARTTDGTAPPASGAAPGARQYPSDPAGTSLTPARRQATANAPQEPNGAVSAGAIDLDGILRAVEEHSVMASTSLRKDGIEYKAIAESIANTNAILANLAARDPVAPEISVNVAPAQAPVVHQDIHMAAAPAPNVHQDIHVAAAPAPTVEANIVLQTPAVPADTAPRKIEIVGMPDVSIAAMPARSTETTVTRDAAGDLTGSRATERDA